MVVVISKFFAKFCLLSQIPKTVQLSTGKNLAKCNALNSYIECVNAFAVMFADPQREGYKLHSLLGSVGKRAETNFNFPAPPINQISGICKNLAHTWPAATRVLSRGRKREDPGNEVGLRRGPFQKWCHLTWLCELEDNLVFVLTKWQWKVRAREVSYPVIFDGLQQAKSDALQS